MILKDFPCPDTENRSGSWRWGVGWWGAPARPADRFRGDGADHRTARDERRRHRTERPRIRADLRQVAPAERPGRNPRGERQHGTGDRSGDRSEEHTSELQSRVDLVCRLLLEK